MEQRCLTRATLRVIATTEHTWDGIPHVTQLLNGTMLEFLKVTKDYAINPKDRAFALLGSSHHKLLENSSGRWGGADSSSPQKFLATNGFLSELSLNVGWMQGTLDLLEAEGNELTLTDAKTWGSNRLVRGNVGVFDPRSASIGLTEVTMQMNAYRVMAEQEYGWHITRLQVQCTVRDGGLAVAVKRGVKENIYLIPVSLLPDEVVSAYFKAKANTLMLAVVTDRMPEPCSNTERWGGNRCKSYCEVAGFCPVGINYV